MGTQYVKSNLYEITAQRKRKRSYTEAKFLLREIKLVLIQARSLYSKNIINYNPQGNH